jgi:hypothetical protein
MTSKVLVCDINSPCSDGKRSALAAPADRAFLTVLARVLPQRRRHGLIVTPQTLLR